MGALSTLLHDALDALLAVSPAALAAALALHVLKIAAEARSWHGIVAHAYRDARFRVTFGAFTGGIAANVVLPGKIGEALRLGIVRKRVQDSSSSTIAATIVLETVIETAFSAAVVVVVLLAGRSVGALGTPFDAVSGALRDPSAPFVAVGTLALGAAAFKVLGPRLRAVAGDMRRGFAVVGAPAALGRSVLAWKLLAWTFRLAAVY